MRRAFASGFVALGAAALLPGAQASTLEGVSPVTDRVLLLHFVDGKAIHETLGHANNGRVEAAPLDVARATSPTVYRITSTDDPAYRTPVQPQKVGRKSKAVDFSATPDGDKWVLGHWIYLVLPEPLQPGKTYSLDAGDLVPAQTSLTFDPSRTRSETIHVNTIGFVPTAPQKFAYLSAWMGDLGSLSLDEYSNVQFHVIDRNTGRSVLDGRPALRKRADGPGDSAYPEEGTFSRADVWEMDFSSLSAPGEYVISVDRIGCSFPFRVDADIYRQLYITTARALYHQRCGIERTAQHTTFTRPACHRPETRPYRQTSHRQMDGAWGDGSEHDGVDRAKECLTGELRTDVWGGWHDAGDWDRESNHIAGANALLVAYELAPTHFKDGELNIPESGNGIPDTLDEAAWCIDYYRRIQRPDGGVSVGFFQSSFPKNGQTPQTDPMEWYMYAEEPAQSYRYAAGAARLAWCLKIAGKADLAQPYIDSAAKAWDWAGANLRPGDEAKTRDERVHAAACLFKVTGEAKYQDQFKKELLITTDAAQLVEWPKYFQDWAAYTYATTDQPNIDQEIKQRLIKAILRWADGESVQTAGKRAGRQAYGWYVPMSWCAATMPRVIPLQYAYHLSHDAKYLAPMLSSCDYVLGGNPLNMTWLTGVGPRHPMSLFRPESWYDGTGQFVPGIVPGGPTKYTPAKVLGRWQPEYGMATAYPDARIWPPHELWFENRYCPLTNEFTVQCIAETAAAFGLLCDDAASSPTNP